MKKLWYKLKAYISENLDAEQERLIAWVPFLFGLGIALYFALPFEPNMWLMLGFFELWLVLFYLLRYKNLTAFFVVGLFILGGFLNIEAQTLYKAQHIENISDETVTYLKGKVQNISYSKKGKKRLLLTEASDFDKALKGDFRITIAPEPENLKIGQCVEMVATIFPRTPLPVRNGYRLDRKYFYENMSAIGYSESETFVTDCPQEAASYDFIERLNLARNGLVRYIGSVMNAAQSGVAAAVVVGEKTLLPKQIVSNYRDSGLAHFLSVSGLHLGAIAGLIFFVVRLLLALFPAVALKFDIKKIAAVCAIIGSAFYLLISGMAIPAQRAFIMTTVVLVGVMFNRQAISMRMVSFAALVVLIIAPQALISISFQMSFAAVYALVAFYESYKRRPYRKHGVFGTIWLYLSGIVVCDLVASLATAPFSLYHFHRLALWTSLGNLLAGPLIGLYLMPLILACLAMLPFGAALYPLKALGFGIDVLNRITDMVAHLPHSVWQTDALPLWALLLIVCGGFWLCVWQRRWRWWGAVPILFGIIPLFFPLKEPDMVFSPRAEDVAVRDNNGDLVMLPRQNDAWVQNLWAENLHLKPLSRKERENLQISDLKCAEGVCVYKDAVTFDATGKITLGQKQIDNTAGGYIFLKGEPYWRPLWNNKHCRLWQQCTDKE